MRVCIYCGEDKEWKELVKDKRSSDGVRSCCNQCKRDDLRLWKTRNTARWLWLSAKHRAIRLGRVFEIVIEDIEKIIPESMLCSVTGERMCFISPGTGNSPSLDRVDNSLGYLPDNIQIISHRANCSKY